MGEDVALSAQFHILPFVGGIEAVKAIAASVAK